MLGVLAMLAGILLAIVLVAGCQAKIQTVEECVLEKVRPGLSNKATQTIIDTCEAIYPHDPKVIAAEKAWQEAQARKREAELEAQLKRDEAEAKRVSQRAQVRVENPDFFKNIGSNTVVLVCDMSNGNRRYSLQRPPHAASCEPRRFVGLRSSAVYTYVEDGLRHYTSTKPAIEHRVIRYEYPEFEAHP